jgi:hypothetical protein
MYSLLLLMFATQSAAPDPTIPILSPAEQAAIFRAAGGGLVAGKWVLCAGEPQPEGATIDEVRDINHDGRPDAIVGENGSYCYGATGHGFKIVSQQADHRWKLITGGAGMPEFVGTGGIEGWPDLSIGGPGFCFPVQFWNKFSYSTYRYAYDGKPCLPNR